MIKSLNGNDNNEFLEFCDRDVFGTRIKSYFESYGLGYDFVSFYAMYDELNEIHAAVCLIDGDFTVSCDGFNLDELFLFINFLSFKTVQCCVELSGLFEKNNIVTGYIVEYSGSQTGRKVPLLSDYSLKDVYNLASNEGLIGVGEYLPWLSDAVHRINTGHTRFLVSGENHICYGCAAVLFETGCAAILGCVATYSKYRGKGIASSLVLMLANEEINKGKRTELLCKKDSIVDFYIKNGFIITGEWGLVYND